MNENILFEAIRYRLKQTMTWRTDLAAKFAEDGRNTLAAKRLEELSHAKLDEIDAPNWKALENHSMSPALSVAVCEATRDVGFRSYPRNINDLVQSIVTKIVT